MVYYDKFGHIVPMGQEDYYFKNNMMDFGSEMDLYANKQTIERNNILFGNIKERQEEERSMLFPKPTLFQSTSDNSKPINPPIIITDLLKRHGIL